jgi:hypothetical protein
MTTEPDRRLTEAEHDFLRLLDDKPKSRKGLPLADRAQDKVRQQCKKNGWAKFIGGWIDGVSYPMGWVVTPRGRAALARSEGK